MKRLIAWATRGRWTPWRNCALHGLFRYRDNTLGFDDERCSSCGAIMVPR